MQNQVMRWLQALLALALPCHAVTIYIDGQAVLSGGNLLGIYGRQRSPVAHINLVIGRDDNFPNHFCNGWLDEVAVYDYALSSAQIAERYRIGCGE